ncbi:MAG TPA: mycothiol system anti-sigma-R factor [Candidatus Corynebacterium gallistercoris]|uniref:Mycothiol system anti-sigma-R factor n=1 Tax=Candidatus Corynebacterium gallistercoris TaxID=2838530 RepID=A0A9D1URM9_9CORY|nr:mycothiol system anti-sigma-R factor [Candidatus Corynebacterium gallistercoris]
MEHDPYNPCQDHSGDVNCDELLEVLYEFVDGGGTPEARARLQHHADACPSCLQQLGIEQQVRQLLRSCCAQQAPVELRARITTQLRVEYRRTSREV